MSNLMDGSILNRYLGGNIQDFKQSKPSKEAIENARFFLSLFKQFRLLQQR